MGEDNNKKEVPLRPTAMFNFNRIDKEVASIAANFWRLIWNRDKPAVDQKSRYLLSLAEAVGARRFRQATREFVKAYAAGVTVEEFDELFSLFVWNEGVGTFASEIGPSPLFGAYKLVKDKETEEKTRSAIVDELKEEFGESNPEVGTVYRKNK